MEKLIFKTEINASRERVWNTLLGKETYPLWASVFSEGSDVRTDWQKGSKAFFIDTQNRGMVSEITENIPHTYLSITHLGMYDNGVEDLDSDAVKDWAGATENYSLKELDGKTELTVEMGINAAHKDYFENTWPKALEKVKELAEQPEVIPPVVV